MTIMLLSWGGWARADGARTAEATPFPEASVRFEQNATDGDVEVVFAAKGDDEGLAALKVVSPDGRTVIDFTAPDPSTLGMRQFKLETPEPRDVAALKAAYPEGAYAFTGTSVSGRRFVGRSTLSHRLPMPTRFRVPAAETKDLPVESFEISWSAVPGVEFYIVEVEQDRLKTSFQAVLPSSATSLSLPDGFLMPGTEYKLSIGTVANGGNTSFVETSFTTGNQE